MAGLVAAEAVKATFEGWQAVIVIVALFVSIAAVRITYHRNYWRNYFNGKDGE